MKICCLDTRQTRGTILPVNSVINTHLLSWAFAAGIGENAPIIRDRICDGLGFLGVELSQMRNAQNAPLISPDSGRVKVRVIRTDEELMLARSTCQGPLALLDRPSAQIFAFELEQVEGIEEGRGLLPSQQLKRPEARLVAGHGLSTPFSAVSAAILHPWSGFSDTGG